MNSEENQIVCLLDVLGFKNLFANLGLKEIELKYRELISIVEKQNSIFSISSTFDGVPITFTTIIQSAYFSDTIIFWCKYDIFRLEVFLHCMMEIICKSIEINLPLRGAISIGKVKIDKEQSIFLGKPIIDAANAEKAQKWIGITFAKACEENNFINGIRADCVLQYDIHIKEGKESDVMPVVIDFPRNWRKTRNNSLIETIKNMNTDLKYKEYYENTIDFANYSKENKEWWKDLKPKN